jgi:hypothetical protein
MATYSKLLLSGSTNGRSIKVAATATPGTLIHTAVTGTTSLDEIWLEAFNSDTVDRKLTIEFGGTTSPDDTVELTIPAEAGPIRIIAGWLLQNGLLVRAFCATANVVMINGFVNRIA